MIEMTFGMIDALGADRSQTVTSLYGIPRQAQALPYRGFTTIYRSGLLAEMAIILEFDGDLVMSIKRIHVSFAEWQEVHAIAILGQYL